jgi:hypothetical protein
MGIEDVYYKALDFAKRKVEFHKLRVNTAEDLVSEAYLLCVDSSNEITFDNLISNIKSIAASEKTTQHNYKREFSIQSSLVCMKCGESKPSACFGITLRKSNNTRNVQPYCRDCYKIVFNKWFNKNKDTTTYKEKERARRRARYLKTGK